MKYHHFWHGKRRDKHVDSYSNLCLKSLSLKCIVRLFYNNRKIDYARTNTAFAVQVALVPLFLRPGRHWEMYDDDGVSWWYASASLNASLPVQPSASSLLPSC